MKKSNKTTNPTLDAAVKATKETSKSTKKAKQIAAAVTTDAVTSKRETEYKFPADCTSLKDKKAFRSMVRRKIKSYMTKLAKLQASELKEDQELFNKIGAEYEAFIATVKVTDPLLDKPAPAKKTPKAKAKEETPKAKAKEETPEDKIGVKAKVEKPAKPKDPDASIKTVKRKSKANKQ